MLWLSLPVAIPVILIYILILVTMLMSEKFIVIVDKWEYSDLIPFSPIIVPIAIWWYIAMPLVIIGIIIYWGLKKWAKFVDRILDSYTIEKKQ